MRFLIVSFYCYNFVGKIAMKKHHRQANNQDKGKRNIVAREDGVKEI